MEQQRQYVGIDLHRRRSVIVRVNDDGEVLECVRIANGPVALSLEVAKAGSDPGVTLEATYSWCWAADLLHANGYPWGVPDQSNSAIAAAARAAPLESTGR